MNPLMQLLNETGELPLSWAGSTMEMNYLNFGDALSPVMVALLSGAAITRIPSKSKTPRMAAVGTIGHGLDGGEVWFWGTGCSNWRNPSAPASERIPFAVPADSVFHVPATRGPVSARLLGGRSSGGVYGDPVWLLPRFYKPTAEKKFELGVILHLSELADRAFEAHPKPEHRRFEIPADFAGKVHLINTVTPIGVGALRDKIDEILACKRIVSTSLHGMVIAESYGIPCLYFPPNGAEPGLSFSDLDPDGPTDLRIVDLYKGIGKSRIRTYNQPRSAATDWQDVVDVIDKVWEPVGIDEEALIEAFPANIRLVAPPVGGTIWDHPVLTQLVLQHSVADLKKADRLRTIAAEQTAPVPSEKPTAAPHVAKVPAALSPREAAPFKAVGDASFDARIETLLRFNQERISVPLSWVATTNAHPYANLGDALSPVIVSAIAGYPARRASFDHPSERMVAVGTIGHAQKNGVLHFWGTGLDATLNPVDPSLNRYTRPPNTEFLVHAVRGRQTANVIREQGIAAPDVFGDPVWFLPRVMPMGHVRKTHELGVVLHISELVSADPQATVKEIFRRYNIPPSLAGSIRLINTYTAPNFNALTEKVEEIASCRRIVSTSLHGMVIAEAYGVPCGWFGTYDAGRMILSVADAGQKIDHRVRDFYSGVGKPGVVAFCQDRGQEAPWEDVMAWIDKAWEPLNYDGRALFNSFPLRQAVSFADAVWPVPNDIYLRIPF
jgi:hypothetical protein